MLPPDLENELQVLANSGDTQRLLVRLAELDRRFPNESQIQHFFGWASMRERRFEQAIAYFREAVRLRPNAADSLNLLGLVYLEQEQIGEAINFLKAAVAAQTNHVSALTNLGLALCRVNLYEKSLFFLNEAVRLNPANADGLHYLGYAYLMLGRLPEADQHLAAALAIRPGCAGYLSTLGLIRERQHRAEEATRLFTQAVETDPSLAECWNNLGTIQAAVWGNYDIALQCFERCLQIKPRFVKAIYHRGMVELVRGDFARGWADYELRPTVAGISPLRYGRPSWQGEPLAGKTILLHCEQGLGDTLQFVRYAVLAKNLGARVVCEVQKQLLPLLANASGIDQLLPEGAELPAHDYQISFLSMPHRLGIYTPQSPYLFAAPERLEFWQERIKAILGFKIGLAWQGESGFKYDWLRSVPLQQFAPLARLPTCSLISLQKHHGVEQIVAARQSVRVIELDPPIDTTTAPFMDTAAIMKHLDLVITSDTAIAHLAGGLGVPVWVATVFAPDWRWLLGREDTPWYPTMRLFRQPAPGQWDAVFQSMAAALAPMLAAAGNRTSNLKSEI